MNIDSVPSDAYGLLLMAVLLGVRHGFDADHLAAIDCLARLNRHARKRVASAAGAWFSIGHGLVVIPVAVLAAATARPLPLPDWLQRYGAWASIGLLTLLAGANVVSVLRTRPDRPVELAGWRTTLLTPLLRAGTRWSSLAVGALFALSFDTISLALLFALLAVPLGGGLAALGLSAAFVTGMFATDGLNGWWLATLLRRADRHSRAASRAMAIVVAGVAFVTAAAGALALASAGVGQWLDSNALWLSLAIVAAVALTFRVAFRNAYRMVEGDREHPESAVEPFAVASAARLIRHR